MCQIKHESSPTPKKKALIEVAHSATGKGVLNDEDEREKRVRELENQIEELKRIIYS
jgi:hypothetical protein